MADDNITSQADEVEALSSIYGDEWCVINAASRTYCIRIVNEGSDLALRLQITMPDEYPSTAPPQYSLSAPWLRGPDRQMMQNELEDIYLENMGEIIVYLWVEKLREILAEQADELKSSGKSSPKAEDETEESAHYEFEDIDAQDKDYTYENYTYEKYEKPPGGLQCPEIFHGGTIQDRKSTFQGHIARVNSKEEVDRVMEELLKNKKIAAATHNIVAYRIEKTSPRKIMMTGSEDDGETHAGNRVLHLLQLMGAVNVLVVITRWYGGIHLGPDRFKHINNCARELLEQHGFRNDTDDKKGPRSGKKK